MKGHNELKVNYHNEPWNFEISFVGESMYSLQKTNYLSHPPCIAVSNELNKFLQHTKSDDRSNMIIFEDLLYVV